MIVIRMAYGNVLRKCKCPVLHDAVYMWNSGKFHIRRNGYGMVENNNTRSKIWSPRK